MKEPGVSVVLGVWKFRPQVVRRLPSRARERRARALASIGPVADAGLIEPKGGRAAPIGRTWLLACIYGSIGRSTCASS